MHRLESEPRWFRNRVRVALDSATWVMTQKCRQAWHYHKDIWVWCKMLLFICHPQHHFWSQTACVSVCNPRCVFSKSSSVSDYICIQCLFSQDSIPLLRDDSPMKDTCYKSRTSWTIVSECMHVCPIWKPAFHSCKALVWIMFDTARFATAKRCHNMTDQLVLDFLPQHP